MNSPITSFDEAYQELQQIAQELEDQALPVEELSKKVERAALLTRFCKERLRVIETDLHALNEEDIQDS